ncbi:hypothetical protein [Krasilnikovia sp. MM14-A1004]|uniref:hypothetical protein n=1 Tax=Krasilnikovia sp. MM14-A1004 TaxID=3373541 RepID=UPI00399CB50F
MATETRAETSDLPLPHATRVLQFFPVTCLMVAPYVLFIIPQAVSNGNPRSGFLIGLVLLGAAGAGLVEGMFLFLRPPYRQPRDRVPANAGYPRIMRVAVPVAVVSIVADVARAAAGGGSIESQVTGQQTASTVAVVLAPFGGWKFVALALFASACLGGYASRRNLYLWAAAMIGAQVVIASFTAITANLISFCTFVAVACLMLGLTRARLVAVFAVILLAAWPTIFAIRNQIRADKGIAVSAEMSASGRIRLDQQISAVAAYDVPADLPGLIGPGGIVRYGLVPRALDPGRPVLATGGLISDYVGGSRSNSYNFLPLGTLYFLLGPYGVIAFYGLCAFGLVLLLRTGGGPGPGRLMVLFTALAGPLSWTSSYPESVVGYLQSLVGLVPIMLLLRRFGRAPRFSPNRGETPAMRAPSIVTGSAANGVVTRTSP